MNRKYSILGILSMAVVMLLTLNACNRSSGYSVTRFGAVCDGRNLDTEAIQSAIDACAESGGGTVNFPAGRYLSGTLMLRDHVNLHLQEGATLLGSTNPEDYPEIKTRIRSYYDDIVLKSLIFGEDLSHVSITGKGTIDGQGEAFVVSTKKKPDRYLNRPHIIRMIACNNVQVKDINMRNSAMWMQHYLACENLTITGIKVYNHANQNNDMIDIDGCRNVIISDCYGDTDDDALTFKSTSEYACENITVTNCIVSSHCNAIKCGTESTGGFKNFTISNCVIKPSADEEAIFGKRNGISGISLEIVDGGVMDGITISNISMDGPEVPIFIRLGNRARKHFPEAETPTVGELSNVLISQVTARNTGKTGCAITGIPGYPVRNIKLSNMILEFAGGVTNQVDPADVPELEEHYPESTMFGELPAYAFFIRHAEDISFSDITATTIDPDIRKPVITQDVRGITLTNALKP